MSEQTQTLSEVDLDAMERALTEQLARLNKIREQREEVEQLREALSGMPDLVDTNFSVIREGTAKDGKNLFTEAATEVPAVKKRQKAKKNTWALMGIPDGAVLEYRNILVGCELIRATVVGTEYKVKYNGKVYPSLRRLHRHIIFVPPTHKGPLPKHLQANSMWLYNSTLLTRISGRVNDKRHAEKKNGTKKATAKTKNKG